MQQIGCVGRIGGDRSTLPIDSLNVMAKLGGATYSRENTIAIGVSDEWR
jgi:hypothetical protein